MTEEEMNYYLEIADQEQETESKPTSLSDTISKDAKQVISFLFDSEETKIGHLKEHFQIIALNRIADSEENENPFKEIIPYVSLADVTPKVNRCNSGELLDSFRNIKYDPNRDYYISINPLKTAVTSKLKRRHIKEEGLSTALYSGGKSYKDANCYKVSRTEKNIMGLKNIVIDIDCHNLSTQSDIILAKNKLLNSNILKNMPTPTAIIFSGRGFHIYYSIYEASTKLSRSYKIIAKEIANKYQEAIVREGLDIYGFEVDALSSEKIAGLIRIPGTKNILSGFYSEICFFEKIKYNLNELKELFNITVPVFVYPKKICKINFIRNSKKNIHSNNLLQYRLQILEECVKNNERNMKSGFRDKYCFVYYNIMKQIVGPEKAFVKLEEFNNKTFSNPLPGYELKNLIKGIEKTTNGFYKLTNEKFATLLGLNHLEIKKYNLINSEKKEKKYFTKRMKLAQKKREQKKERDKKIILTYSNTGSIKKTANLIGVCENTVRNVINKNPEQIKILNRKKRLARDRRVFNNFLINNDFKKAAKAGKCCINTAKKIVKTYNNIRKDIDKAIEEFIFETNDEEFKFLSQIDKSIYDCQYNEFLEKDKKIFGRYTKNNFISVRNKIYSITNLSLEEITIAMAPYLLYVKA